MKQMMTDRCKSHYPEQKICNIMENHLTVRWCDIYAVKIIQNGLKEEDGVSIRLTMSQLL